MHKALEGLETPPDFILVDGNYFRPFGKLPHQCFIRGDGTYASIAAASILAKTARDRYMQELHPSFPHYSWHTNKGYPTIEHREAIIRHGITIHHRRSFRLYPDEDGQLGIFDEELSSMD
jgi:ribonuclease HII